ncbi:MAG: ATP synthase gamma chain [bacterium ADurb.Bin212]|nr:MAG: ATP synthase gamma chain [bacterium ADurb.Bin212]
MPSLETLKNNIQVVEELADISNTLEQIAARDILKVRERTLKSRDYFNETWKIYSVLRKLAPVNPNVKDRSLVVMITFNRGMCGSLLNKVISVGDQLYKKYKADLLITGRKGHSHFANRNERTIHFFSIPNQIKFEEIEPLKDILGQYSAVHIVFPRYYSATKQDVEIVSLMLGEDNETSTEKKSTNYLKRVILPKQFKIEPTIEEVVDRFNKTVMGILVYNYFSEALLAYSAAQVIAMRNANNNASEERTKMIHRYHKMTREIIDIKLRELYKSNRNLL